MPIYAIERYSTEQRPHLEELDHPESKIPISDGEYSEGLAVKGVVQYIINDATTGEFDDCPVM